MARSHHRKKHKEQLRHFKHKEESGFRPSRSKAANIFAVMGCITGLAVGYFASGGSLAWCIAGLISGGVAGYWIGHKVDTSN
jgi:outer membrane lipoprotein SlyB